LECDLEQSELKLQLYECELNDSTSSQFQCPGSQHLIMYTWPQLSSILNPAVIVGDFNTPDINWLFLTGSYGNHFSNSLYGLSFEHHLNKVVNCSTHSSTIMHFI